VILGDYFETWARK